MSDQKSPIIPSLGRVVLVRLVTNDGFEDEAPAIVNGVHSNEVIDVCLMPSGMAPWPVQSLAYHPEDAASELELDHIADNHGGVWRWMPYQVANADKSQLAPTAT